LTASQPVSTKPPATRRILDSARALVARGGAAQVSMGDVAAHAGVSKALVHYHFHDKDSLLLALVDDVGRVATGRARAALDAAPSDHVLDAYWGWLDAELRAGDIRILIALSEYDSDRVRAAVRRVTVERREIVTEQIMHVFTSLGLTPRVPAELVGDTVLAFIDGLMTVTPMFPGRDPRPSFDVLWLALLALAE
jgi:TetR/AcrR family transcriptional repressor of bet genes